MAPTLRELFVDRDRQIEAFRRLLEGQNSRRIMLISAGPGMGKSWLLRRFAEQAAAQRCPRVQIDFGDGLSYDALTLVRRCRDALGSEHFAAVTQAINDATTARIAITTDPNAPPPVTNVNLSQNTINSSTITINAEAVGTVIKDNQFIVQTDNPLIRQVTEDRVNAAFFESLARLAALTRVVFLFDTYDRTSLAPDTWLPSAADRWVVGQLLARIRDGALANVFVVLAGRRLPEFGIEWNEVLGRLTLDPLVAGDVAEYLRVRRGLTMITAGEAERLAQAVAGSPQVLALIGDNLVLANKPQKQDDDW